MKNRPADGKSIVVRAKARQLAGESRMARTSILFIGGSMANQNKKIQALLHKILILQREVVAVGALALDVMAEATGDELLMVREMNKDYCKFMGEQIKELENLLK